MSNSDKFPMELLRKIGNISVSSKADDDSPSYSIKWGYDFIDTDCVPIIVQITKGMSQSQIQHLNVENVHFQSYEDQLIGLMECLYELERTYEDSNLTQEEWESDVLGNFNRGDWRVFGPNGEDGEEEGSSSSSGSREASTSRQLVQAIATSMQMTKTQILEKGNNFGIHYSLRAKDIQRMLTHKIRIIREFFIEIFGLLWKLKCPIFMKICSATSTFTYVLSVYDLQLYLMNSKKARLNNVLASRLMDVTSDDDAADGFVERTKNDIAELANMIEANNTKYSFMRANIEEESTSTKLPSALSNVMSKESSIEYQRIARSKIGAAATGQTGSCSGTLMRMGGNLVGGSPQAGGDCRIL